MDKKNKQILAGLQKGLPITIQPFQQFSDDLGLPEKEVITRIDWLRKKAFLRRIGFSFNTHKLGLVSTLVACKIPKNNINHAQKVIMGCANITHNYLRKHRLNMWFTFTASSPKKLKNGLIKLKKDLKTDEMVSLPTEKILKLRFALNVE
ncbi:MAG: Lrp/AsnC family transcriptional regulator [Candidatus Omnitrophica bacterium]|nr:Lrp/AsnC family transcriptional regulator [Candidatus Omnitrophota bacterium]